MNLFLLFSAFNSEKNNSCLLLLQGIDKNPKHSVLVSCFIYTIESTSTLSSTHPSFRSMTSSKVDYLYEVEYLRDDSKSIVTIIELALVNPFKAFTKPILQKNHKTRVWSK